MANDKTKKSFIFRCDMVDRLSCYSDSEFKQIIMAISNYVQYGELPDLPQSLMFAFNFIKVDIDEDTRKYQKVCEDNRRKTVARWEREKAKKNTN